MNADKRARLEAKGWKFGTVAEFLELTPDEELIVEVRTALSTLLRERREHLLLTQATVARRMGTGQARIAKAEANDPSISTDLLLKAVAATGATLADVSEALQSSLAHSSV